MIKIIAISGLLIMSFVVLITIKWHRTDWQSLDEANNEFIDEDGNHKYYDRHYIKTSKKDQRIR